MGCCVLDCKMVCQRGWRIRRPAAQIKQRELRRARAAWFVSGLSMKCWVFMDGWGCLVWDVHEMWGFCGWVVVFVGGCPWNAGFLWMGWAFGVGCP